MPRDNGSEISKIVAIRISHSCQTETPWLAILPIDHTQARCERNAETQNDKVPMFCRLAVKFLAAKLA